MSEQCSHRQANHHDHLEVDANCHIMYKGIDNSRFQNCRNETSRSGQNSAELGYAHWYHMHAAFLLVY